MAWEQPSSQHNKSGGKNAWDSGSVSDLFGEKFNSFFKKWGNVPSIFIGIAAIVVLWGAFGFYQLDEQERAVVLRLGKFHNTLGPGLRWNPPVIDKVHKVNVTKVYSVSYNGQMLTRDENIVLIRITAQYRVRDPVAFVLRVRNPISSLRHSMESALRHVVGGTRIDDVITDGRERVAEEVKLRLQTYVNRYGTGISIDQLNINEADPPREVKAAFDDVNKALEDEARFKNEAEAYSNEVIPRARGQAKRVEEESQAYKQNVIARAQGENNRFKKLLGAYRRAPDVTRERLYIDTMEEVLSNVSKVVIDMKQNDSIFYLPLDQLQKDASELSGLSENNRQKIREAAERAVSGTLRSRQGRQ